jgi:purine-binding chemotaxis protein CheW
MEHKKNQSNSWLTFILNEQEYGLRVSQVFNILDMETPVEAPHAPSCMKGIINKRGTIVPLIDLHEQVNQTRRATTYKSCIALLELEVAEEFITVGTIIDEVRSVVQIYANIIDPVSQQNGAPKAISGIAKYEDKSIILLDLTRIFTQQELSMIRKYMQKTASILQQGSF